MTSLAWLLTDSELAKERLGSFAFVMAQVEPL